MSLNVSVVVENCVHLYQFFLNEIQRAINLIESLGWFRIIVVALRPDCFEFCCWISHSDWLSVIFFVRLFVFTSVFFLRVDLLLLVILFFFFFIIWLLGFFWTVSTNVVWVGWEVSAHASSVVILSTNGISTLPDRWNTMAGFLVNCEVGWFHTIVVACW